MLYLYKQYDMTLWGMYYDVSVRYIYIYIYVYMYEYDMVYMYMYILYIYIYIYVRYRKEYICIWADRVCEYIVVFNMYNVNAIADYLS